MSDLYSTLQISPRKKRCPPELDDDLTLTPKKLRTAPPTPPATVSRKTPRTASVDTLPAHLARLNTIHTGLQHALSHALATCAVSPTSDTGVARNVLNHISLTTYNGLTAQFDAEDLKRLCWIWEWDGKSLPSVSKSKKEDEDDNPFLEPQSEPTPKDWTRGAMGIVVSPSTHYTKNSKKRVPAYGIGIEVEMDIDKDMRGGMAAVARWTAASETRRQRFRHKLQCWAKLNSEVYPVPQVPAADLPDLPSAPKISALTRTLASASPKGSISSLKLPGPPSSPTRSPTKSPTKRTAALREFAVPFPITPSSSRSSSESPSKSSASKNTLLFPQTPHRDRSNLNIFSTPSSSTSSPSTPVHQKGSNAATVPQTPTSSRRDALYERVRQRSLTASPTKKSASNEVKGGKLTKDQMLKMGQDEMRRRCLLGRLGGIAESVWMLFSTPTSATATPTTRKRRALPASEVATAVIKSSPVPISSAEANESLVILTKLCPFFLKQLNIAGKEWLEMPAPTSGFVSTPDESGSPKKLVLPSSPGAKKIQDSAEELITRSPRRVKREAGGLREVREIIRRELELQD